MYMYYIIAEATIEKKTHSATFLADSSDTVLFLMQSLLYRCISVPGHPYLTQLGSSGQARGRFFGCFFHAGLAFVSELVVRYVLILMKNMHEVYYDEAN